MGLLMHHAPASLGEKSGPMLGDMHYGQTPCIYAPYTTHEGDQAKNKDPGFYHHSPNTWPAPCTIGFHHAYMHHQGCATCCSLAAGLRGNGERMRKGRENEEIEKIWRENEEMDRE